MTFFQNIFKSIYFVIILFFETLINFLIGFDWIVISPFFLLIYFVSTKRFENQNIIPLVISGLSYDIFLSENYLGVYSILFLLVAIISNVFSKCVRLSEISLYCVVSCFRNKHISTRNCSRGTSFIVKKNFSVLPSALMSPS